MCGIAGFVDTSASSSAENTLRRMTDRIAHRGPDDSGLLAARPAFLGHRRLSIIDLSALGHQPMANEDRTCHIVFNGEIFNHAAVRPALERAGHIYRSRTDTETILHAWEEFGDDCVTHFRGMFAFAIWDSRRRRLFCARDRMGIKPFYYWQKGSLFAFASEIKALLEHPDIAATFNEKLVSEYLAFGYTSGEETLFAGIRKMMPGHTLTVDASQATPSLSIRRYWDVPGPRPFSGNIASGAGLPAGQDWIRELRRRLEENIEMRLMSDVPLGMFLSGGVDSSAIAALMKRMVSGPVKTFSVGYAEAAYSELSWARRVAAAIGTDHHEITLGMEDFFNALPQLVWHEDEPIAWPSSVSLYFVSRLAARHVKVVLTGEGSDELFAGYARYGFYSRNRPRADLYRAVPAPLRAAIRSFLAASPLLGADLRRKALHTVLGREPDIRSLYLDNFYGAFGQGERESLVHSAVPQTDPYAAFLGYWDNAPGSSLLGKMLYADQKTYLVELLMKQDQMSMACSIESRVPLLDHTLVEFAASIPDDLRLRGAEGKYVFKKAVEDALPRDIVYRTKMGFPTPLRAWLMDRRAAPVFDLLRDKDGILAGFIDSAALERLLRRHLAGQEDATDRIWRLLNLQLWGEMFLTGRRERWWPGIMAATGSAAL